MSADKRSTKGLVSPPFAGCLQAELLIYGDLGKRGQKSPILKAGDHALWRKLSRLIRPEALSDLRPDNRAEDGSRHKIRKPMNRHRDAQTDVAGINQGQPAEAALLGKRGEDRDRHGEGDGRMRRRPAPKHPAAQPAKPEIMADVRTEEMFRMHPPRERLVSGRQQ